MQLLLLGLLIVFPSLVNAKTIETIVVNDAWVRQVPPATAATSLYLQIRNSTKQSQEIMDVICPTIATSSMFHETRTQNGMILMDHVDNPKLKPGESLKFQPGGLHIMLMGLKPGALQLNNMHECKMKFTKFAEISFSVSVKK